MRSRAAKNREKILKGRSGGSRAFRGGVSGEGLALARAELSRASPPEPHLRRAGRCNCDDPPSESRRSFTWAAQGSPGYARMRVGWTTPDQPWLATSTKRGRVVAARRKRVGAPILHHRVLPICFPAEIGGKSQGAKWLKGWSRRADSNR